MSDRNGQRSVTVVPAAEAAGVSPVSRRGMLSATAATAAIAWGVNTLTATRAEAAVKESSPFAGSVINVGGRRMW